MSQGRRGRYPVVKWAVVSLSILAAIVGWRLIFGRASFDADRVARAETRMWQAYYAGNKTQIGLELISLLRNQYGLSLLEAKEIGGLLASSAMKFRSAKGDYEKVALGDLTEAYRLIKQASGASFDPEEVARAELAWWVARRTPGQNSAEQVGGKIARLYALLYGGDHPSFLAAGILRAEAGKLRDSGGKDADWVRVEEILRRSYHELAKAM